MSETYDDPIHYSVIRHLEGAPAEHTYELLSGEGGVALEALSDHLSDELLNAMEDARELPGEFWRYIDYQAVEDSLKYWTPEELKASAYTDEDSGLTWYASQQGHEAYRVEVE